MVWSKLIQRLDFAMSTMSLFSLRNINKFITHTLVFLRKDRLRVERLSIMRTKLRGRVEVIQDGNNELNVGDDVFQLC
jgi:hypothetical protein